MNRNHYEQPICEVIEMAIEQGFSLSNEQQESAPWEDL